MSKTLFPPLPVLLVDDDDEMQKSYAFTLKSHGINNIVNCPDSRVVAKLLADQQFQIIFLDLNMPHIPGIDLLPDIVAKYPDTPVIVVTGVDDVKMAVDCMRGGAFDYMVKPIEEDTLIASARRAFEVREVRRENALLKEHLLSTELKNPAAFAAIITGHRAMHAMFQYIEAVSGTPQPILITGETGVGKELVAKAIHDVSGRSGKFVPVNIAGLDDNVFADTLFGHVRGAFTGAMDTRKGLVEQATGGTLFLDEIGDLNATSQVKLLRLVQEREYFALGSDSAKRTDARIIVATNRNLQEQMQAGAFREDLFFRLRSHLIYIPALRDRMEDLPMLIDHFLAKAAAAMDKRKPTPPDELFTLLSTYHFPGNLRELEAMCFNAVSTHKSGILELSTFRDVLNQSGDSPHPVVKTTPKTSDELTPFGPMRPLPTLRQAEDMLIEEALKRTDGNQTMAADLLGITRQTLNRHLKRIKDA
ncbi:MAG: sigma-54 dependent transcriptional regulator [Verrucomicrobia bacterium]|nr:sigma-54 dependent transcriptional regulator [Verrucomicrobiota bacterium]